MAKDLIIAPQLPAPSNPARLPSLPAWLQQRSAALGNAAQRDSQGKYRQTPVLPPNLILSSSERQTVADHIDGLSRFLDLEQPITLRESVLTNDQAHGVMIASLLIKGGGAKLDKASADALTEDYLDAIEDLPAWSVREALRKWNRGESPRVDTKPHDFNWRPTPPTLRRLAQIEVGAIKARIINFEKLLNAVPLIEYSDEHCVKMLNRIAEVLRVPTTNDRAEAAPDQPPERREEVA